METLLILIIDTLALLAWGKYLHHLDRFTTDKKNEHITFWFIVAGGILDMLLVFILYPLWYMILFMITGLEWDSAPAVLNNMVIVGPVEELTKFLVFIALSSMTKSIKEPRDGIIQAASVALGFALCENFIYARNYGMGVLVLRSFLTTMGHMTYSVIWSFTWASYIYTTTATTKSTDKYYIIPSLLLTAFIHGSYNALLEYNHKLFALATDLLTLILFKLVYSYVKENSPYKSYALKDYELAIPALDMGLKKYPESYELNKRMGIFHVYIQRYKDAERFLKKAKKLNPKSLTAKFYYGAAKYLTGDKGEGLRQMNNAISSLPVKKRRKMVSALKKIITDESLKEELFKRFSRQRGSFYTFAPLKGVRRRKR